MQTTVRDLAELVQGELFGDGTQPIRAARPLGEAQQGDITFVEHAKYAAKWKQCPASAAVVPSSFPLNGRTLIRVADPLMAFVTIVRHLHSRPAPTCHGLDPLASIHPSVQLGPEPSVHPFAVIGEGTVIGARCRIHSGVVIGRFCRLGDDVVLYPNAVLYDETIVGHRVILHAHAVVGSDGYGYRFVNGQHVKIPQLGHVEIGNDVEIGAGTTIDRATFEATRIGAGTKIDNLAQIGHNCQVGRHNLIISQVGMAGSSSTGDYTVLAGQVGIRDHVHLGHRVVVGAQSGVTKDVPEGERLFGTPARPEREQKRILATMEKLPEMRRDLRRILKHLGLQDEDAVEERKESA